MLIGMAMSIVPILTHINAVHRSQDWGIVCSNRPNNSARLLNMGKYNGKQGLNPYPVYTLFYFRGVNAISLAPRPAEGFPDHPEAGLPDPCVLADP